MFKMHFLIIIALAITFLITVRSHPICQQAIDQQSTTDGPTCSANLTGNVTLLEKWLSLHDESKGIDQLRRRSKSSITSILLDDITAMVIILIYKPIQASHAYVLTLQYHAYDCLNVYQSMVVAPQSVNASVDNIRGYFNAYLMHKAYIEYLVVNLSAADLLDRKWVQASNAGDMHDQLKKLLSALNYNVKHLVHLVSKYVAT